MNNTVYFVFNFSKISFHYSLHYIYNSELILNGYSKLLVDRLLNKLQKCWLIFQAKNSWKFLKPDLKLEGTCPSQQDQNLSD